SAGDSLRRWAVDVPSLGQHIERSFAPGTTGPVLVRDLLLSALGSGIVCGLGYADIVRAILREPWRELRFFLCSAYRTVPVCIDEHRLAPLDGRSGFAQADEPSAALTQLLLSTLPRPPAT